MQNIPLSKLELNTGQLEGLPRNPRFIRDEKYLALKRNIQDYPEMLRYRGLLVYPLPNGHYIIIGGNMRYRAMRELGFDDAPCVIVPESTPVERLRAYTILDNNAFGQWDWDLIANEWEMQEIGQWGMDTPIDFEEEKEDGSTHKEGEEEEKIIVTFPVSLKRKKDDIKDAVRVAVKGFSGVEVR